MATKKSTAPVADTPSEEQEPQEAPDTTVKKTATGKPVKSDVRQKKATVRPLERVAATAESKESGLTPKEREQAKIYPPRVTDRTLRLYLKEVAKIPQITPEEEKELGRRIQQGDEEALRRLVEANLRFVIKIAKKYRGYGVPFVDLINEGNLGLIEAARRFDPERNVKFTSYAVWWIRQAILQALSALGHPLRLPPKVANLVYQVGQTIQKRAGELRRRPTLQEIAEEMNISEKNLENILELSAPGISLSQPIDQEGDIVVGETISDTSVSLEEQAFTKIAEELLEEAMDSLDPKERRILELRYGLRGNKPHTLKEIGKIVGLSRERVRQIEMKAIEKLRQHQKIKALVSHLN